MTPEQAHCAAVAAELVAVNGPCRLHPAMDYDQARAAVAEVIERERADAVREALRVVGVAK